MVKGEEGAPRAPGFLVSHDISNDCEKNPNFGFATGFFFFFSLAFLEIGIFAIWRFSKVA